MSAVVLAVIVLLWRAEMRLWSVCMVPLFVVHFIGSARWLVDVLS